LRFPNKIENLGIFDNVCKFLVESFSQDFAQWLLGEAIALTELSPSELSIEPIRADSLILLGSERVILHLEFQTQPDADLPFRMTDYRLRTYRRYPNTPMHQVVIYLKPTRSPLVQQTMFAIPGTHHQFAVIRLWECPQEDLLRFPGLLPLAILSRAVDKTETLRQIAQRIARLPTKREQSNVAAATSILAGLVLEKAVIQQLLREEIMKESVIYQDIVLQEGEALLIVRQLTRRLGGMDATVEARIRGLPVAQLEALAEALLDFTSEAELRDWLTANA